MSGELTALTNEQLAACDSVDVLVDALWTTSFDLLSNIERMAVIVGRLDQLGAKVDFDNALLPYIRMVSQGKLLGECLVALSGDPLLLEQAVLAPIDTQRQLAAGYVTVYENGCEVETSVFELTRKDVEIVFDKGRIRTPAEQKEFLKRRSTSNRSVAVKQVHRERKVREQEHVPSTIVTDKPLTEPLGSMWLAEVATCNGMPADEAAAVANRVMLHLYRGSIELAREALDDGWRSYRQEQAPLPVGADLLDESMARILDDVRILNGLEENGIETIGDFLKTTDAQLFGFPNFGEIVVTKLHNLRLAMLQRSQIEDSPN